MTMLTVTSFTIFFLLRVIPGDPVISRLGANSGISPATIARIRHQLGLDQPILQQYANWVTGIFHGNFGRSFFSQYAVSTLISQRIWQTLELTLVTVVLIIVVSVPVAVLCAARPNGLFDRVISFFASFGMAFPPFIAGIVLITIFSVYLAWLPNTGFVPWSTSPLRNLRSIVLPTVTLTIVTAPIVLRYLRGQLIEELEAPYVRTAQCKGAGRSRVIVRHALRNALIPALTVLGLIVGFLLGGVVIVEYVFGIPGLGSLAVQAAVQRDYGVLQGVVLLLCCTFILTSLIVDLLTHMLDPRLRASPQ